MDIIYVDELFGLNFIIDYLLLLCSARLRGAGLHRWRFALGAALGGGYAVAAVLPGMGWLTGPLMKLAVSGLIALTAFGGSPGFFRSWLWFLSLSAAFGGAVFGAALLAGQEPGRGMIVPVSTRILALSLGLCYAAVRLFFGRFLQKRERVILKAEILFRQRRVSFSALRDTGNGLYDPVTGLHVLVADPAALAPLFPAEALPLLAEADPTVQLQALAALPGLSGKFRLVPYTAVGTRQGLLVCFRPDRLIVEGKAEEMLVALSPTPLSDKGEYSAVI